jgi:sugar phosphate isomerase/epimerase
MTRPLGCCTWIFGNAPLEETAARVRRAGLQGVEIFGDVAGTNPADAKAILNANGLTVFSVTPADADISHPDAEIRSTALSYYDSLMDWAASFGQPIVSCHGQVGRIKPVRNQQEEDALLVEAVSKICDMAASRHLTVVFEILNRYETHQVRTVAEGIALQDAVGAGNLKLLPDAYHMNIEEADPAGALQSAGDRIGLYHAADSNRGAVGSGNTDFGPQFKALNGIGYAGPIIFETNAPGPNPFTPDKGEGFEDIVEAQLTASAITVRDLEAQIPADSRNSTPQ